jgi:hypothetical protein
MALWGNTDALASVPKFITRKALFDSTAVNTTAETINILASNTGFATGDAVLYDRNGGTAIGGLTSGTTYTARVVGAGLIELYDTYDHAIDTESTTGRVNISSAGTGTQILQRTQAANAAGDHNYNGSKIIFVDAQEAQVAANKAKGITGAGWWAYRTYTDAQEVTRHKAECLVAMSKLASDSGDDEDSIAIDLAIVFDEQPQDETIVAAEDVTFIVEASINAALPLTYQWQKQTGGTGDWEDVEDATEAEITLEEVEIEADGDKYRVVVTAEGITATSDEATLTVTEE